jgi:cysteine peptidase C11 family protein
MKGGHLGSRRLAGVIGPLKGKPIVSIISISAMAVILLASIGIFIAVDDPSPVITGNDPEDKGPLSLEITYIPQDLRAGMKDELKGIVKDDDGLVVQDATVSLNFTMDPDDTFRTTTGPDGSFILPFWSPEIDIDSNINFQVKTDKDGFVEEMVDLELEILSPLDWTFMIYMSDCDLETWALRDVNEMEEIPSGSHLNIVVQLDRWESKSPLDDISDGNWTTAKRFLIGPDDDPLSIGSQEIEDIGEINSGDPDELVDFALWSMDEYPADNYALILWNHGSGIDGICWEQSLEEEDVITIPELGEALDTISDSGTSPLEIIGFDACLMSTIEVAYEIAPYGKYLLGSEITEPNFGWDYSRIGDLVTDPFLTAEDIGDLIIDSYIDQTDVFTAKRSMSLGLYDLSKTENVISDLDTLANTINSAGTTEIYNMRVARKYAQPISDGHSSDAVDLQDFVENIMDLSENSQVKANSEDLLESIDNMVLRFETLQGISGLETDGLNGLSIYSPDFKEVLDSNQDYDDLKFNKETSWKDILLGYYENMELDMEDRVLSFDADCLSCSSQDEDGDFLPDTMTYRFKVGSEIDNVDVFLGINVYNLRGEYVNSTWLTFVMNSSEDKDFIVKFKPTGEDREAGLYRIVAYMCIGTTFDTLSLQDYTRSRYRWLEVTEQ